jgi:hypothetical protein
MKNPKGKLERDADHRYFLDGKPIPGVTECITNCGLADFSKVKQEVLERAQLRGKYVHATIQFWIEGDLVEETLSPTLALYLGACKRFCREVGFKPKRAEVMGYSPIHWVAGETDCIGTRGRRPAIVDWKPPTPQSYWRLQTAGYALIHFPGRIPARYAVQLFPDGTYRVDEHKVEEFLTDRDDFLAALRIEHRKRRNL